MRWECTHGRRSLMYTAAYMWWYSMQKEKEKPAAAPGDRRIESIHTARKVRREEAAKKEFFWRRRTSHLKPSNTSQRQVLLGEITWNLHLLISIWFYIVFLKILVLSCWLVGTERAQIVLLRLVAYLFAQNLFVIFPTNLSPLRDHEMCMASFDFYSACLFSSCFLCSPL